MALFSTGFTKDNLDECLKALAKEYRRRGGKNCAEIILVGGAAILANYGFRNMTTDMDAVMLANSTLKEAINAVGDKFGLPNGWLNDDFMKTSSYTPKLREYSKYFRTYSNVLEVRTISAEYLVAMKLKAGRNYKHDLSDVVGIIGEHAKNNNPLSYNSIMYAVGILYGDADTLSQDCVNLLQQIYKSEDYSEIYSDLIKAEATAREELDSRDAAENKDNLAEIFEIAKSRKS